MHTKLRIHQGNYRPLRSLVAAVLCGVAVRVGAAEANQVVMLPPYIVVEVTSGEPWSYTKIPGFEILSRCRYARGHEAALAFYQASELLRLILPERFLPRFDVPKVIIVYDEDLWPKAKQEAVSQMLQSESVRPRRASEEFPAAFFANMVLTDADQEAIFALVPRLGVDPYANYLTSEYVGHMLGLRVPKLPAWFVVGFLANYSRLDFANDRIQLPPIEWPTSRSTPLLSMEKFFADKTLTNPAKAQTFPMWYAQAELFVRWGIDPMGSREKAFWEFLDRVTREPASETMLRQVFGMGSNDITHELQHYLSTAEKPATWWVTRPKELPSPGIRLATREEIARTKGDWERLQTDYVRKNLPELEQKYLGLARRTLRMADGPGSVDPALLAVRGLCEVDAGDDSAAEKFLERAVAASVVRPRAYYELARIRFAELCAKANRNDGRIGIEAARQTLALLALADRQSPKLTKAFELAATIWERCAVAPQRSDIDSVAEGIALFPDDAKLVQAVGRLYFNQGAVTQADAVTAIGLRFARNDTARQQIMELREKIASGK